MDELIKKQIADQISKSQVIGIYISKDSGFDGLASGLALYLSLKKIGKNTTIIAQPPTVSDAQSLYSVNKINSSANQKDLIITIPDAIRNVDKVSYFIKNDKLKIKIHSLNESDGITQDGITFDSTSTSPDLTFLVGYANDDDMRKDNTHEQIKNSDSFKISIFNGEVKLNSVQINVNNSMVAGLSELISSILIQLSLPIDEDSAFNLYSGIKNSTRSFSPIMIKNNTLDIAQQLIKLGAGKASMASNKIQDELINRPKEDVNILPKTKPQQDDLEALSRKISATFSATNKSSHSSKTDIKSKSISAPIYETTANTPITKVEGKESGKQSWLKPPKIYRGSKSFDRES